MKIRVYYEDTDIGGIVYHANYLKFIERARSELFFDIGESPLDQDSQFVARRMECDFFATATLGDILEVKTFLKELRGASFTLLQNIYKENMLIFQASIKLVHLNGNKVTRIPEKRVATLNNLKRI